MSATAIIHRAIMGRTNVRHYEGGKQEWMWQDLPVEGERSESK
jgi:3-mercaptopyruvate sulfurtransferase SseA